MLENLPGAIGHALREQRAGIDQTAFRSFDLRGGLNAIRVSSLAFADHAPIPERYTADGDGRSPPLAWTGVPEAATSVVVFIEDADSPTPHPLVHAIVVDLPTGDGALAEGALSKRDDDDADGDDDRSAAPALRLGRNSFLQTGWLAPDPPPGHGVHRYAFQVFALGAGDAFSATPGRDELLGAIAARALASGCLIGTYERPDGTVRADDAETAESTGLTGPSATAPA